MVTAGERCTLPCQWYPCLGCFATGDKESPYATISSTRVAHVAPQAKGWTDFVLRNTEGGFQGVLGEIAPDNSKALAISALGIYLSDEAARGKGLPELRPLEGFPCTHVPVHAREDGLRILIGVRLLNKFGVHVAGDRTAVMWCAFKGPGRIYTQGIRETKTPLRQYLQQLLHLSSYCSLVPLAWQSQYLVHPTIYRSLHHGGMAEVLLDAHEPLARAVEELDGRLPGNKMVQSLKKSLDNLQLAIAAVETLRNHAMYIASDRLSARVKKLEEKVELKNMIRTCWDTVRPESRRDRTHLDLDGIPDDLEAWTSNPHWRLFLCNLIKNSIDHSSPDDGNCQMYFKVDRCENQLVLLSALDRGVGLSADQLDRFNRVSNLPGTTPIVALAPHEIGIRIMKLFGRAMGRSRDIDFACEGDAQRPGTTVRFWLPTVSRYQGVTS